MIFLPLFLAAQQPLQASERPSVWAVKDVLAPVPERAGWERGWADVHPLGDPDRDGRVSFFTRGVEVGPSGRSDVFRMDWDFAKEAFDEHSVLVGSPNWNFFLPARSFLAPLTVILNAPDGFSIAMGLGGWGSRAPDVPVVHYRSRQIRGWLEAPPPPGPSWPEVQSFNSIHPAGDVTGDGYDDLLFEAHNNGAIIHGLVSGKTLQTKWQHYDGAWAWYAPIYSTAFGGPADLNGDQAPDFVRGNVQLDVPYTGVVHQVVYAISGRDGSTLWRNAIPVNGNPSGVLGTDCNGDDVRDVLILATYDWMLLDGTDGSVVWSTPVSEVSALLGPGYQGFRANAEPGTIFHLRPDGSQRITAPFTVIRYLSQEIVEQFVELKAESGELVGLTTLVEDLEPWTSDRLFAKTQRNIPYSCCVGDLDRDGLNDLVQRVYAAAFDVPATPNDFPHHLAILGPQTLAISEKAAAGSMAHATLWIPSGPGLEFRLLASTSFDGDGGRQLDGWKTHLGNSPLLSDTLVLPAASGTLDASGKATIRVNLRRWPLPAGTTIWWKAVVLRPGSQDEVHTMSTLGSTLITP